MNNPNETAFGFFPGQPASRSARAPRGYAIAGVRIGGLHETVFCSLSSWSLEDYDAHWRKTAARCVRRQSPVLFCTDLTVKNASLFIGFPEKDGFLFEQWLCPRDDVAVEGLSLALTLAEPVRPGEGASSWRVDVAAIQRYAQGER